MKKLLETACPKPAKRPKSERIPLKKSRVNPVNRKRQKRLFEENFGGEKYLAHIRSLPCDVCGVVGYSVAAHLTSRGAGGKADVIAPLCHSRLSLPHVGLAAGYILGCHELYDAHHPQVREHEPRLRKLAKDRRAAWQSQTEKELIA